MKKYFLFIISLLIVGCGKSNKDIVNSVIKKYDDLSSYTMNGNLKMFNGEDTYSYKVNVIYKKDDMYKVRLVNEVNNHEQIILRNKDGVYVLTPSLNKSFKFQSDWPYNNSQIYIINRLINDIKSDDKKKIEKDNDKCIINTKVNYSTNNDLTNQKIYCDKNNNIDKVEVYDKTGNIMMEFNIDNIKLNKKIDDKEFEFSDSSKSEKTDKVSKKVDNIIYPMYVPNNTYLDKQEKVSLEEGERVILTFKGEKDFTLVEETINTESEISMVMGYPDIIIDTVGYIDDSVISWISDGVEYTIMSNSLDDSELYRVAKSISSSTITK